jgi:hypothetical protein
MSDKVQEAKNPANSADIGSIDPLQAILFPSLRAAPARRRLWFGAACVAVFLATLAITSLTHLPSGVTPPRTAATATSQSGTVGLDFIAFYTAGTFVREGRSNDLYNLSAVQAFQRDLARANGVDLGDAMGPWWNPPFYAWVFVPLSRLPFGAATQVWMGVNLACAAVAVWLLCRMLPPGTGWRSWALVPVLLALSVPFIHTMTHAQNTCTSLLLVTLTVTAWRSGRGTLAGLVAGLLFYKPQLGAVLALALLASLGWRAALGLALTGTALLLVTLTTLPGSLDHFLHQMPANLHHVQTRCTYNWDRHVTFKAFFRLLLQGTAKGEVSGWAAGLTALCTAAVAVGLLRISPLDRWVDPIGAAARESAYPDRRGVDRFIAATIAATPLLMPFYFDYDLLLLSVPAVLFAAEMMRRDRRLALPRCDRWLLIAWPVFYAWLLINADVAERLRLNLAVPILSGLTSLMIVRARQRRVMIIADERDKPILARAA